MANTPRRLTRALEAVPLYPAVLASAFVVAQFSVWWPPAIALARPLAVVTLLAILVQLGAGPVLGRARGAFVAAVAVLSLLEWRVATILLLGLGLPVAWLLIRRRPVRSLDWVRVTRSLNVIGAGALALAVGTTLLSTWGMPAIDQPNDGPVEAAPADAPDIYLLMLDGYPRADTLLEALDDDNTPFLREMAGLGFDLAEQSHSNYNRTALTLPSLLNGAFIDQLIPNPPEGVLAQNRWLASLVNRAAAVDAARDRGYQFIHVPTDVQSFTPVMDVELRDTGQLSFFEMTLLNYGLVRVVAEPWLETWHREEHRARILESFDEVVQVSSEASTRPRIVFAHISLPHTPILFHADGSDHVASTCYWFDCEIGEPLSADLKAALREQVDYTNARTLAMVRLIVENSDRPPVIVVFSDHGFRHWTGSKAETYRSVLLALTPGKVGVFPETATPVTLIPRLLHAYLGTDLPLQDEDVWFIPGGENGYFPFIPTSTEPE